MAEIPIYPTTRALIFDIDGTLVDTMPVHYKASQLVCNAHGFDFPLDFFNESAGIPTEEVFEMLMKKLKLNFDGRALGKLKDIKYIELMNEVKPLRAVYDIALKFHGVLPMALGTGATKPVAFKTLEAAGLKGMFDIIITPEDVQKPKPAPDTFLLCAKRMGIEPQYCQVFEDGNPGIKAAIDGGMMVVDIRKYINI
jgi:beta-phosphoglucomutase-like phosphatase (HAD superfamily)